VLWQQVALPRRVRSAADLLYAPAYTAPLRPSIPVVLGVHDLIALDHPRLCSVVNRVHMQVLLPPSIRRAAAIAVSSAATAARIGARFPDQASRVRVVPFGVDAAAFARAADLAPVLRQALPRPYFLFVGNLEPKKGLDTLIEAYAATAGRTGCDLAIAGRPAWRCRPILEAVRAGGDPGRVHLLGRVDADALAGLYQHAQAFVFPSRVEGFGLPVLEAMAAGTPVIHSDDPAVVETAGGAGVVVPAGAVAPLAAALIAVAESAPRRETLAALGRARAQALSWSRWAETILALFQSVADAAPRRASTSPPTDGRG
jgi:glycosyltransferase involved in cell wall biosynthesis